MDNAVLDLVAFYQKDLRETKNGREALDKLHVSSSEVVDHFSLGYASGRALAAASEEQYQVYKALGLAFKRRERFHGCVVVPVYNEDGRMVDLCGLRPYPSGLRYIFWRKPMQGLIGVGALRSFPEIVLCDTPIHALHVRQHGFPNVAALRKANELKSHLALFEKYGVGRVYLVSRQQRGAIIPLLEAVGVEVICVKTPAAETVIPRKSLSIVAVEPVGRKALPEVKLVARTESRLHFAAGDVTYIVDSIAATKLGMRVRVRAKRDGTSFIDRIDLL